MDKQTYRLIYIRIKRQTQVCFALESKKSSHRMDLHSVRKGCHGYHFHKSQNSLVWFALVSKTQAQFWCVLDTIGLGFIRVQMIDIDLVCTRFQKVDTGLVCTQVRNVDIGLVFLRSKRQTLVRFALDSKRQIQV